MPHTQALLILRSQSLTFERRVWITPPIVSIIGELMRARRRSDQDGGNAWSYHKSMKLFNSARVIRVRFFFLRAHTKHPRDYFIIQLDHLHASRHGKVLKLALLFCLHSH